MFFPLLLLICSLSTAEIQTESDNEIIPVGEETEYRAREPANVSFHHPCCPQDIHAVLREMSTMLAEHRVELRHLQQENEAQAAKLRELDLQKTQLDKLKEQVQAQAAKLSELDSQKTQLDKLKQQVQAQAAKLSELDSQKTQLDKLKQQVQAQAGEVTTIKARTNVTENQVEALKRDTEVRRVAFSASLLASGYGNVGPFNTITPLVFQRVVTNIGNAYSPHTGFFIAPERGAYHFEVYIGAGGHATHPSGAVLVRNGQNIFIAYEHQPSHYGSSANGATLLLEVGDVVFLHLWPNAIIYDSENHHSTFSGHLLFTM